MQGPSGAAERRARHEPKPEKPVTTLVPKEAPAQVPVKELAGQALSELVEFTSVVQEDPNEGRIFGDMPEHCTCPHCERSVVTFIDHEASWVTWVLGIVVWFSLGWMAFWVLPLLWPAFKDVVHHCPRCLNVIARKSRINLPTFRTEIMSFKIGGCAIVLARKYVVILVALILAIVGVYVLRSTVPLNTAHEVHKGAPSMMTWEDFLFDCGPRTSLGRRASTAHVFEEKYRRRSFKWQGEVRMIREGFDVLFVRTKSVVMVTMYPHRYPRRDLPDVALLFGEEHNAEVAALNQGDWIAFEATMTAHGYRGDPEVMTLWHVETAPRPSPLSSSAHARDSEDDDHEPHHEVGDATQHHDDAAPEKPPHSGGGAPAAEAPKEAPEVSKDEPKSPNGIPDTASTEAPKEAPEILKDTPESTKGEPDADKSALEGAAAADASGNPEQTAAAAA